MTFLFDIGRVLLDFDFESSLRRLLPAGADDAGGRMERLLERRDEFESGAVDPDEYIGRALELLGSDAGPDEFRDAWRNIFTPVKPMWERVGRLSAAGHRLILFSNTNAIHCPWIFEAFPQFSLFHDAVLSYQVGSVKPHAPIYEHAIRTCGLVPEETLYIDDLPDNIATGRRFGFQCHTYDLKHHEAFEDWLSQFDV
jgi:putative hydrolase of the HAD superfamily